MGVTGSRVVRGRDYGNMRGDGMRQWIVSCMIGGDMCIHMRNRNISMARAALMTAMWSNLSLHDENRSPVFRAQCRNKYLAQRNQPTVPSLLPAITDRRIYSDNMISSRMLSREEEASIGEEKEVRREDQEKINRFSRLHSREKGLEQDLQTKQKDKEDLEEISNELELADEDEKVHSHESHRYKIGDSFFALPLPEVQELLTGSVEKIDKEVSAMEERLSELREEMQDLKTALSEVFKTSASSIAKISDSDDERQCEQLDLEKAAKSRTTSHDGSRSSCADEVAERDGRTVVSFTANDPENPHNWSQARRLYVAIVGIILVLNSTIGSSIPAGAANETQAYFHVQGEEKLVLTSAIYLTDHILTALGNVRSQDRAYTDIRHFHGFHSRMRFGADVRRSARFPAAGWRRRINAHLRGRRGLRGRLSRTTRTRDGGDGVHGSDHMGPARRTYSIRVSVRLLMAVDVLVCSHRGWRHLATPDLHAGDVCANHPQAASEEAAQRTPELEFRRTGGARKAGLTRAGGGRADPADQDVVWRGDCADDQYVFDPTFSFPTRATTDNPTQVFTLR
nr:prefoldin subunit 4 [Quercus suber]